MKMMIQYKEKSDRFGISPFAIGMTHPDTTFETQLTIQIGLGEVTNDEMLRYATLLVQIFWKNM